MIPSAEPQGSTTLGADVLGEEVGRQVARKKEMTEQELAKMQRVGLGMGTVALETELTGWLGRRCVFTLCVFQELETGAAVGGQLNRRGLIAQRLNDVLLPLSSVQDQASRIGSLRKLGMSMGVNPRKV